MMLRNVEFEGPFEMDVKAPESEPAEQGDPAQAVPSSNDDSAEQTQEN